jgi:hypothetical protein
MSSSMTIACAFHIDRRSKGRQEIQAGEPPRTPCARGRVPRVAKLLALAHRFEGLVRNGEVADYAELARLGRVSRARISQVMSLLSLAPDLQEAVLFLPRTERGRDPIQMRHLLPIAQVPDWKIQRQLWAGLTGCERD